MLSSTRSSCWFPEGSYYDENYNVILPEGYMFDIYGNVVDIQAVLDTLPEGSYFDETAGQFVLAEGYTYDMYGNVITNEQAEELKNYPEGSYYAEDGTIVLPEVTVEDNDSKEEPAGEDSVVEENNNASVNE